MRKALPVFLMLLGMAAFAMANGLTPEEQLGRSIYFDLNLSINQNQACASCHAPEAGFVGADPDVNEFGAVYEGSIPGRFGNRKPPAASYATPSPILRLEVDKRDLLFVGGNFWDGRATGERLGNPAADQALGPFLNPAEQALPDSACVVYRVCLPVEPADYPVSFEDVWGAGACDIMWPMDVETACATEGSMVSLSDADRTKVDMAYDQIGLTIAAFEDSFEVNQFSSKFDFVMADLAQFTKEEKKGFNLFKGKAKCAACHVLGPGPNGEPALFTDFTFDNLGVPRNPDNPVYRGDPEFVDLGLGGFLEGGPDLWAELADENMGKHKVPSLRNVALAPYDGFVKAFGHNGYFKSLESIVHFYNTRDAKPTCPDAFTPENMALAMNCWPEAEVEENVNTGELGDLHLTQKQEEQLVAFLKTLSDGYMP